MLDFDVTDGCYSEDWCDQVDRYAEAGKAIFAAEYDVTAQDRADLCADAAAAGISLIFKEYDLDARGARCNKSISSPSGHRFGVRKCDKTKG